MPNLQDQEVTMEFRIPRKLLEKSLTPAPPQSARTPRTLKLPMPTAPTWPICAQHHVELARAREVWQRHLSTQYSSAHNSPVSAALDLGPRSFCSGQRFIQKLFSSTKSKQGVGTQP